MTNTMNRVGGIKKLIGKDGLFSLLYLLRFIPDKPFLELEYRFLTGKKLNLKRPVTYNEKLQYLKLYDRKPVYTVMADKYAMRGFVRDKLGEGYTVPLLGVWSKPEDIDFDILPDSFVLKCNHDSKGLIICRDKVALDRKAAMKNLSGSLCTNMFWAAREWPYKNIEPKIIAEPFLENIREYQVMCFNGDPRLLYVMSTDAEGHLTENFYDMDFNEFDISLGYGRLVEPALKPDCFENMKRIAAILSDGCPHLRVDFLLSGNTLYVGELTFYNDAGFAPVKPEDKALLLGSWISLP